MTWGGGAGRLGCIRRWEADVGVPCAGGVRSAPGGDYEHLTGRSRISVIHTMGRRLVEERDGGGHVPRSERKSGGQMIDEGILVNSFL